jgi:RHS repeat-associated protein
MVLNTLIDGQKLRVALPLFSGIQPMVSYSIAWYNATEAKWVLADASPLNPCAVITDAPISNPSTMIIVQHESNVVAYLDDGMVYSNTENATLRFDGEIDATTRDNPGAVLGCIMINYLEHTTANPSGIVRTPLVWPMSNDGNGLLFISKQQDFVNKITVTGIQINVTDFTTPYTYTENFEVNPGQMLTFVIDRTADEMSNADIKNDKISAIYGATALSFESMSFSEGVIKGTEGSWSYDYYLKDHLGSTRMVLDQDGLAKEALMYQPYGNVSDVPGLGAPGNDPLREKFTTKEFDEEGVLPDDQRMAIGIVITMPDNNYTGTYATKINTETEPVESPLYNEVNGSGEPTLQCFESSTLTGTKYYEYIEIKIKNTTTGVITTYHLDGINWAGQIGHLKRYTLDNTFAEVQNAINNGTNLFVEGNYLLGNSRMNLSYFGARYYDPDLGIFLSTDPEEQYWSPFTYCGNDPINTVDFDGTVGEEAILALQFSQSAKNLMETTALLEQGLLTIEQVALQGQQISEIATFLATQINSVLEPLNKLLSVASLGVLLTTVQATNSVANFVQSLQSVNSGAGGNGQTESNVSPAGQTSTPPGPEIDPNNSNNPNNFNKNEKPTNKNDVGIPKSIKSELAKIKAGNGTPRIDPKTGSQTIHTGSKSTQYWKGAKEWDVPGTKHRILEAKSGKFGYAIEHNYRCIKPF